MVSSNLKSKSFKIPLYSIAVIGAGFYIGYNEGKGIDTRESVEYLTKYFPTAFSVTATPTLIKLNNSFQKWFYNALSEDLSSSNLKINLKNNSIIRINDLDDNQKNEINLKVTESKNNLESIIKNPQYLKPTILAGTSTAIHTLTGYMVGRILSQIY